MRHKLLLFFLIPMLFFAQNFESLKYDLVPVESKFGTDTIKCNENLSIYSEFYKQKNYLGAIESWTYLFKNAPKRTKNIFIHGANMYKSFIKNEQDSLKKFNLLNDLLFIYDARNFYFPGQEGLVKGMKGAELYRNNKAQMNSVNEAYNILKESFSLDQEKSTARALNYYFQSAAKLTSNKLLSKEELIDLFSDVSNVIEYKEAEINQVIFDLSESDQITSKISKKIKKNQKELKTLSDVRSNMERILAPHVTCEKLTQLYSSKFKENIEDYSWLERAAQLLKKKDCVDSSIYYDIAAELYSKNPSARSAFYMGILSVRQENYIEAKKYFTQAVEVEIDNIKKADYLFYLASTYAALNNYKKAKQSALDANRLRSSWGKPYILIGDLYAKTSRECGENTGNQQNDEFTKRVGYWAAIEKYEMAKKVDPNSINEADKKISIYQKQMPDKISTFNIITLQQETYQIDCWYSEVVKNPYYSK
ncbi:MAG: hypothetical protein CMP65_03890 [Flavobacteriales bacterium]|nr:hypothetical protein [Flavobacteriales bacterium]|tara:strand:- start:15191 stop:16627 length:1437 start_codon:yes stop_codon:yes gene_type:complete